VSGNETVAILPDLCVDAAGEWRAAATWSATTASSVRTRCSELLLGDYLIPVTTPAAELDDELHQAAMLLDRTVEAVQSVGFDPTSTTLGGDLLDGWKALSAAIDDGQGAGAADLDDPDPLHGEPTAHFGYVPLFGPDGPQIDDVHQGSLGDCWLMAVLASVADGDPEQIRRMVNDNGDGTYTVTIDGIEITVDDEFPVYQQGGPAYATGPGGQPIALWPLVIEKAFAQYAGGDYADIKGDDAVRAHDVFGGTDEMSMSQRLWSDPSDGDVLAKIEGVLADGRPITVGTGGFFGMGGRHAWSITGTGTDADGKPTITIRNPWGYTGVSVTGDEVGRGDGTDRVVLAGVSAADIRIDETTAEITMPLHVFTDELDELDYVTEWDDE
jgi:Calpain family cysteine protease